jgi:hypothetical protein
VGNKSRSFKIYLVFVVLFILGALIYSQRFFYNVSLGPEFEKVIYPALPEQFVWEEGERNQFDIQNTSIITNDGEIETSGVMYVTEVEASSMDEVWDVIGDFQTYYDSKIDNEVWKYSVEYAGVTYTALRADGGGGGVIGYVSTPNISQIGLLALIYESPGLFGTQDIACPCTLTLKVFEGDYIHTFY